MIRRIEDSDGWRFYTEDDAIDGRKYISVTKILDCAVPEKLQQYMKKNSANAQAKRMTETADIGTAIHALVENDLKGIEQEIPTHLASPFRLWQETRKKHNIKPMHTEIMCVSRKYGFAGTCDMVAEIDGVKCVADLKTGFFSTKAGFQISAYRMALIEMGIIDDSYGMAGIQIKRDGSGATVFKYEHLDWCLKAFVSCFEVWKSLYFTKLNKMEWPFLHVNSLEALQ